MTLGDLKTELQKVIERGSRMAFAEAKALMGKPLIEDHGDPVRDANHYFQTQIELLDSWTEEGDEILHLVVTARDLGRVIGGDVYVRKAGAAEIGDQLYEYVQGVPQPLD